MGTAWGIVEGESWRVLVAVAAGTELLNVPEATAESVEAKASALAAALRSRGYRGEDILLGLAAQSCLVGRVDRRTIPGRGDDTTLLYAIEDQWPVSAEEVTVDFLRAGDWALGVAAITDDYRALLESLESQGVRVRSICPWPLLALQGELSGGGRKIVVWQHADDFHLFEVRDGLPVGWTTATAGTIQLQLQLLVNESHEAIPIELWSEGTADQPSALETPLGTAIASQRDVELDRAAIEAAQQVLAGSVTPWIDLRRGALGSQHRWRPIARSARVFVGSLVLLLCVVAGSLLWRAWNYEQLARRYQSAQEDLFRQILPDQAIPSGVRSRLESELARLTAEAGIGTELPARRSALEPLVACVQGLPGDFRYRVESIGVDGTGLTLRGEVNVPTDVARITEGLTGAGFKVSSPSTTQADGGFVWDVTAVHSQDQGP